MGCWCRKEGLLVFVGVMGLLTVGRYASIFREDVFVDFLAYVDVAQALAQGKDPFSLANLTMRQWGDPPMVFPGYVLFFLPFAPLGGAWGGRLFLVMNLVFGVMLLWVFLRRTGCLDKFSWAAPGGRELLVCLAFFFFLNSSPFLAAARQGQTSIVVSLCLALTIFLRGTWARAGLFGLAAVLKYSMLPLLALALFVKRKFLLCVAGFALFLVLAATPALFGNGIVELYRKYMEVTRSLVMDGGFNTFAVSGYNMLQFDFLQSKTACFVAKFCLAALALLVLAREAGRRKLGLNAMLLLSCLTMLVSYHRMYDLVLVLPQLSAIGILAWRAGRRAEALGALGFILFFFVPLSLVFAVADKVGGALGGSVFILSHFDPWWRLFPVLPLVALAMAGFAAWLYLRGEERFEVEL